MNTEEVINIFGQYLTTSAGISAVAFDFTTKDNTTNLPYCELIINESSYPNSYAGYAVTTPIMAYFYFPSTSGDILERGEKKELLRSHIVSQEFMKYMRDNTNSSFVIFANVSFNSIINDTDAGVFVDTIKVIMSADLITVV